MMMDSDAHTIDELRRGEPARERSGGKQALRLALAGDTMLGRGVAEAIARGQRRLLDSDVVAIAADADVFLLNLECCISERGQPWPAPGKPFFFRAPPRAGELLAGWGVDCVSIANNHALDYGHLALLDTLDHLRALGIAYAGAGADLEEARAPRWLDVGDRRVAVIAATDHPADFAATPDRAGVAYADLRAGVPDWLQTALATAAAADARLCLMHWGPNMTAAPVAHVRQAASQLRGAGASLIAGSSAHVPHGAADGILYDLGDFIDDYAIDPRLRNDLGLLFLVTIVDGRAAQGEAIPLALDFCHTRLASGCDAHLICERFARACADLGGEAELVDGRVQFELV
jgi:poly-gamma-glutamate capsule biosynthesis protein CapA/YwtB (metallophosphatase superfamily)